MSKTMAPAYDTSEDSLGNQEKRSAEREGPDGEPSILSLDPVKLPLLEECLDAINLGDGFLITGPEDDE